MKPASPRGQLEAFFRKVWMKVNEPRVISALMFAWYLAAFGAALYCLFYPPLSLAGQVGSVSMRILLLLLALGSAVGAIAALPGWYWLERYAVVAQSFSFLLYFTIIIGLHISSEGNRILQALVVYGLLLSGAARYYGITRRPYRESYRGV